MAVVAGARGIVVRNVGREQILMELVVYLGEEIVLAAVEYYVDSGIFDLRYVSGYGMAVP